MTDASDSGVSSTDNITNVTQPTFIGTGVPFAAVTLYAGTQQVGFGVVMPSGQWRVAPNSKLSDGIYAMSVRQTSGGVQSNYSNPLRVVIDTTAPAIPNLPDLTPSSDHGTSPTDNITNLTTPTFQNGGRGDSGDFISLYNFAVSDTLIGGTAIANDGTWRCTVTTPLPSGTHSYVVAAQASDLAGNTSPLAGLRITVDTDKPAAAQMPDLVAADDSGAFHTDNITNVTQPTFAVKGDPNARVELYSTGISPTFLGRAVTNQYGTALVKTSKPLNGNQIYAVNYDVAGNAAAQSSPALNVTIDITPPVVSTPSLLPPSDDGIQGDNLTNDNTPTIGGSCDDYSSSIAIYAAQGENGSEFAGKVDTFTGAWTATTAVLQDGAYEIGALATDLAGNVGKSATLKITIDTIAPARPSLPDLLAADDTGVSNSDNITNKTMLNFSGIAPASSRVTLYNGASLLADTLTNAAGQWKAAATFPKGSPLHITATAFDSAGNASAASPQLFGMLDTTYPQVTLTTPAGTITKNLNLLAGEVQDPTENGDASGVANVYVSICRLSDMSFWSGGVWSSTNAYLTVDHVGTKWSKTSDLPLAGSNASTQLQTGKYKITLVTSDKAGNADITSRFVIIDTIAPTVAISTSVQNASWSAIHPLTGTATDNIGVQEVRVSIQRKRGNTMFYWNGTAFTTAPASLPATVTTSGDSSVSWKLSIPLPKSGDLDKGSYLIVAAAYDEAGNVRVSTPISIMVDPNEELPIAKQFSGGAS